jgi:crotonobetainyl-CoA:carnitine CoA-transferase CaiB-like acyl-CoA transferase
LRILDMGVIVAGGELGRLFADLGAEVIKIESAAYPDGLRQTAPGMTMSRSWALTHRNESSLGLDLRHPDGAGLFRRLVARADAVFANFKPGTLASLGFSYQNLREINPRIVLAESSAFGASGPWSARMGYGPLVRATTGVTSLWTTQDAISEGSFSSRFFDATTVFPDHVVGRITAVAALAALIARDRTGTGAHVHISQAEAAVNQLATAYVTDACRTAQLPLVDDEAVHAVYPCDGDDEWCVISVRSDDDRAALAAVMGRDDLPCERADLLAVVSEWTAARDKADVTERLQRAGVPAAPMNRAIDIPSDPQVSFRKLLSDMTHPLFNAPMPSETGPAPYTAIPRAQLRPAPMPGEQTLEICQTVLELTAEETDRLIADGVLFADQRRQ